MSVNDGGPAFPLHGDGPVCGHNGMSLRDWFAGQALAYAFEHSVKNGQTRMDMGLLPEEWATKMAYAVADAMLAARGAK